MVVAIAFLSPLIAVAQSQIEEIVVTASPIRDSLASAIATKRNANNVMDVISADTIGRFPDQNLADSLGRMPGIAIERDQGQARFINFRGAPFRYTSISFDGINVLGAENGRVARFDAFPSVITRAIEANKAVTPDLPGESISGHVNIKTFDPMEIEGFNMSVEAGQGQQELGDVGIDRYNARVSYSNENFGAMLYGSHDLRGRITDNRELELTQLADGEIEVENLDFRSYRGERENNAYGGRLEFAFDDAPVERVFISSLFNEFIDREERNQFDFDFTAPVAGNVANDRPVSITRLLEDGLYDNSTFTSTIGADLTIAGWESEARLSYTETENNAFLPIPRSLGLSGFGSYDISDIENPILSLRDADGQTLDPNTSSYPVDIAIIFNIGLDTEATGWKWNSQKSMQVAGIDTDVKIGLAAQFREAIGGDALAVGGFPSSVNIASFATGSSWDTDFRNTIDGRNFDNKGLRDAWEQAAGGISAPFGDDTQIVVDENIYALYGMGTAYMSWGELVYGARVEITDFETTGLVNTSPVKVSNDYSNFLPSVNANINLSEDWKLRLAVTTGISRPTYQELRASSSVDATEVPPTISGGNPYLDEEQSIGFDASLEWYFSATGLFSASAYHRSIDNVIYADSATIADGSVYAPGLIPAGTASEFNSYYNGDDGSLSGLEFNFIGQADMLPAPFDGFGTQLNVTFLDSEFSAPTQDGKSFSLPGTSDLIYNASLYYEKGSFSARVNYMYRDDWLSTTENDSLTEFWAEEDRLDFSLRYELPIGGDSTSYTVFANANNLTDAIDVRYANTSATPNQVEGFGRRYLLGMRVDF